VVGTCVGLVGIGVVFSVVSEVLSMAVVVPSVVSSSVVVSPVIVSPVVVSPVIVSPVVDDSSVVDSSVVLLASVFIDGGGFVDVGVVGVGSALARVTTASPHGVMAISEHPTNSSCGPNPEPQFPPSQPQLLPVLYLHCNTQAVQYTSGAKTNLCDDFPIEAGNFVSPAGDCSRFRSRHS